MVLPESAQYLKCFLIMNFAEIALFQSYAVINLPIAAAIYDHDVVQVGHTLSISYYTDRATFNRTEYMPTEVMTVSAIGGSI